VKSVFEIYKEFCHLVLSAKAQEYLNLSHSLGIRYKNMSEKEDILSKRVSPKFEGVELDAIRYLREKLELGSDAAVLRHLLRQRLEDIDCTDEMKSVPGEYYQTGDLPQGTPHPYARDQLEQLGEALEWSEWKDVIEGQWDREMVIHPDRVDGDNLRHRHSPVSEVLLGICNYWAELFVMNGDYEFEIIDEETVDRVIMDHIGHFGNSNYICNSSYGERVKNWLFQFRPSLYVTATDVADLFEDRLEELKPPEDIGLQKKLNVRKLRQKLLTAQYLQEMSDDELIREHFSEVNWYCNDARCGCESLNTTIERVIEHLDQYQQRAARRLEHAPGRYKDELRKEIPIPRDKRLSDVDFSYEYDRDDDSYSDWEPEVDSVDDIDEKFEKLSNVSPDSDSEGNQREAESVEGGADIPYSGP
jgi:hypothetical protein